MRPVRHTLFTGPSENAGKLVAVRAKHDDLAAARSTDAPHTQAAAHALERA